MREGVLLGEGVESPAVNRRHRSASITVAAGDQFGCWYDQRLRVSVHDNVPERVWAELTRRERKGGGLFELDEDATPEERRQAAAFVEALAREQEESEGVQYGVPVKVTQMTDYRESRRSGQSQGKVARLAIDR